MAQFNNQQDVLDYYKAKDPRLLNLKVYRYTTGTATARFQTQNNQPGLEIVGVTEGTSIHFLPFPFGLIELNTIIQKIKEESKLIREQNSE